MPFGFKDIPAWWAGNFIKTTDLDPAFSVPSSAIAQGQITPDMQGIKVWNASGGTLTAGTLVYVSGWNGANSLPQVSKAIATDGFNAATHVVLADIANGAAGTVGKHFSWTAQNTNAATVGDPVWLDVNAGGVLLTTPSQAGVIYQIVGRVAVKSATVGVIDFNLETRPAAQPVAYRQGVALPTIGTAAGTYAQGMNVLVGPVGGTLAAIKLTFEVALAQSDTNFVTFQINNRAAGAGNTPWLATTPAGVNTTKSTGGKAVAQYTDYGLTGLAGPFSAAGNDFVDFTAVVTGTLSGALTGGFLELVFALGNS